MTAGPDDLVDTWIDGRVWRVPRAVDAHIKWLSDCNARIADKAVEYAKALAEERQGRAA
jgi:hypothetical protein